MTKKIIRVLESEDLPRTNFEQKRSLGEYLPLRGWRRTKKKKGAAQLSNSLCRIHLSAWYTCIYMTNGGRTESTEPHLAEMLGSPVAKFHPRGITRHSSSKDSKACGGKNHSRFSEAPENELPITTVTRSGRGEGGDVKKKKRDEDGKSRRCRGTKRRSQDKARIRG